MGIVALALLASSCGPGWRPEGPRKLESVADASAESVDGGAERTENTSVQIASIDAGTPTKASYAEPPDETTYVIDQSFDDIAATFEGKATIAFTNPTGAPLAKLPLLLHPNAAGELGMAKNATGAITVVEVRSDRKKLAHAVLRPTLVEVRLVPPLAPRARLLLDVSYRGRLRRLGDDANDMMGQALGSMASLSSGNHAADYGLLAVGDGILTAASAYPMVAPFREGAFDTSPPPRFGDLVYNAPARFSVTTRVANDVRIVTNLVERPPTFDAGTKAIRSEGRLVRDFVLVAGRDLDHETMRVGSTRITSTYRPRDQKAGHAVLEAGAAALRSFEKRFGPYPWPELDLAEASIVGGAGGVEFCGMALIGGMFYRPPNLSGGPLGELGKMLGGALGGAGGDDEGGGGDPSASVGKMLEEQLEFIVAHEVAHQYFAGLVGNDARRFPDVDEPLAQFAASLVVEDLRGRGNGDTALEKNAKVNYAMFRMLKNADKSVRRGTSTYKSPVEYAGLVYGKAPYLYASLRHAMGDEALFSAIRGAVEKCAFRMVTLDEWVAALEASAPSQKGVIRPTFRRYLDELHGDLDLGVDESGDLVVKAMFPTELASTLAGLGIQPRELLRSLLGGKKGGLKLPGKGAGGLDLGGLGGLPGLGGGGGTNPLDIPF